MRTRIIVLVAAALMLVPLLAACGAAPTATPQPTATTAPVPTVAATVTKAATAAAPAIPHDLTGRENCLQCHGATGVKPFPAATHASYTNQVCQNCHKPKS